MTVHITGTTVQQSRNNAGLVCVGDKVRLTALHPGRQFSDCPERYVIATDITNKFLQTVHPENLAHMGWIENEHLTVVGKWDGGAERNKE